MFLDYILLKTTGGNVSLKSYKKTLKFKFNIIYWIIYIEENILCPPLPSINKNRKKLSFRNTCGIWISSVKKFNIDVGT
jgi:hypothetical protein